MAEPNKQSYLKGAAILAATVAVTKVIGAIYKIPLYNLLHDEGTGYFNVTYTIYNLLLTVSTAGVPVALSRLIAAARASGRPQQAKRIYRVALAFFALVGVAGSSVMFFFSHELAGFMGRPEVWLAVELLSPSVFFACLVSVLRGYSQGHNDMVPTSISQIMEVLCKLIFGLIIAWYLARQGKDLATVAAGAIVGVTIGLGLAVPVMALYKRRIARRDALEAEMDVPRSVRATLREILSVSIPITVGASTLNIITLIDTKLIQSRLQSGAGFDPRRSLILYGAYSKGLTLFNIPSAFITPVAVAVVPVIAAALARKRPGEAKATVESSIKLTNLIAMPAAVGLAVLSRPIYEVLFPGSDPVGPRLLALLAIASYFVCTYLITNGVLQASGFEKLGLFALPLGGLVKIGVNWLLVGNPAVNITGAPIGTLACYVLITLVDVVFIALRLPEKPDLVKITARPAFCTALMGAAAWGTYGLLERFVLRGPGGGLVKLGCLVVSVGVAVAVYAVLVLALRVITREDALLLPKGEKIANLLRLK